MTGGTCQSFGGVIVLFIVVVGRIFVFVGGLAIGGVAMVILPCLNFLPILSTKAKYGHTQPLHQKQTVATMLPLIFNKQTLVYLHQKCPP